MIKKHISAIQYTRCNSRRTSSPSWCVNVLNTNTFTIWHRWNCDSLTTYMSTTNGGGGLWHVVTPMLTAVTSYNVSWGGQTPRQTCTVVTQTYLACVLHGDLRAQSVPAVPVCRRPGAVVSVGPRSSVSSRGTPSACCHRSVVCNMTIRHWTTPRSQWVDRPRVPRFVTRGWLCTASDEHVYRSNLFRQPTSAENQNRIGAGPLIKFRHCWRRPFPKLTPGDSAGKTTTSLRVISYRR